MKFITSVVILISEHNLHFGLEQSFVLGIWNLADEKPSE